MINFILLVSKKSGTNFYTIDEIESVTLPQDSDELINIKTIKKIVSTTQYFTDGSKENKKFAIIKINQIFSNYKKKTSNKNEKTPLNSTIYNYIDTSKEMKHILKNVFLKKEDFYNLNYFDFSMTISLLQKKEFDNMNNSEIEELCFYINLK